ncbi:MAG TPA: tetratricopeptide repeat protein [Verrucomicrobiae bacterium]|nr:tetratricopeptide repeat protein [Verrucomicrobiae bacterium]
MTGQSNTKDKKSRGSKPCPSDIVFCLVCGLLVGICTWFADTSAPFQTVFSNVNEDNYNLLVQGFSAGQLNLKEDAPPGLAKLSDPYDPNANAPYLGGKIDDLTYYKGKLYLYFGVTPALVLFWPYYAITGHFLSERAAVAFFMGIGFAAIAGVLLDVRRRYFPDTGKWIPAAGTIMPGLALALTMPVNVHETAITCGFAFAMLALAALWVSLHKLTYPVAQASSPASYGRCSPVALPPPPTPKVRNQKLSNHRLFWLALASLAYGLAIGARPTLLFGAAILLLPVLHALVWCPRFSVSRMAGLLLAATGPIACIGLGLMLYNFERFNNPFEFGWHYQLNSSYRAPSAHPFGLHYLWFNARLYFLEPFHLNGQFPFLKSAPLPPTPPGYDLGNAAADGGILMIYPVALFALAVPFAWRRKLQGTALGWFAIACLIIFMAGAVTLSLFFASANNYELDFLPGILLLALIGTYCAEHTVARFPGRRRLVCAGWHVLMSYSIVFNGLANVETRAESHFFLGNLFLAQRHFDEAEAEYQKTLALFPECADAYGGLANVLYNQGRLDDAINNFQRALEINPDFVEAHNNLGFCFLQKGRVDDAITHYEVAVQMRPGAVKYQSALGNAYARKGLWDKAIIQYQKSVELQPDSAVFRAALANAFCQKGMFDNAIAQYQKALAIEPDLAGIHERLGDALFRKGDLASATVQYESVVKLQPGFAQARNNLAYCYQHTGREDEAIAQYQKAIELDPGFAQAYNNLGDAYRQKRMASQAMASYQKAIDLAPQFVTPQLNLAWMLATWPDPGVRNGAKAVALAKHLNDYFNGNDPKILRTLAAAYAETGRFAEASSTAKQALALASDPGLIKALQAELNLYLARAPLRSTAN